MTNEELNQDKNDSEELDIHLHPGDCFGWYSHTSSLCHPTSCLKSEWCKSYTINRANQTESSAKKSLDEIGKDSSERIKEKTDTKEAKKSMADLGKQAFFDKIVSISADNIKHDRINYNPNRTTASLKVGGRVVAFLDKKKSEVVLELGGRNKGGPTYRVPFGESLETAASQIENFIEEQS